jgi:hypothetical protein
MDETQIAKTIFGQLMLLGAAVPMSWGIHAKKIVPRTELNDTPHLGGLLFKVQGRLFKGHVLVRLLPSDTYQVDFGHLRKGKFNTKDSVSDVYFDQLAEIIDRKVETK